MATRIDYRVYERNCKNKNKRGLLRGYSSLYAHPEELGVIKGAGVDNKILFSVSVDVSVAEDLIKLFRSFGFKTYGDDYYYLECRYNDYMNNEKLRASIKDSELEALKMELLDRKARESMFIMEENDNTKFYILPYNDECHTVYEFLDKYKKAILDFSKIDDVTITMNPVGYSDQIQGFIGFNFYDLDEKEDGRDVEVSFTSGFNIAVDFKKPITIFSSTLYLTALGSDNEELNSLNVALYGENYH